ncbi:putative mitochondrial protein [Tanacetum coccineum]
MTKVTDVEANLEQYKIDQAAINSEAAAQRALLQETIEKNKVEVDRQFAELMNAIKTQLSSTTTPPVILPPPTRPMPTPIYSNVSGFTQPLIYQQPQHPTQTPAYTSFSGLHFDSQGFLLPMGTIGFGPFVTGEQGSNYNRRPPMSKEGTFMCFGELSLGNSEGISSVNTDDVYEWVYQVERFFDIKALQTTGERLRAAMMCLEGPSLSWFHWSDNRKPFRSWEELKQRLLVRFQPLKAGSLHEQFFAISQTGTAREYITLFERMAAQLPGLQEEVLEGIFIKVLRQELRTAELSSQRGDGSRIKCLENSLRVMLIYEDEDEEDDAGDEGKPIAYFSQVLGPRAQLKSVYERELMAIVMAVQKWRPYLLGRQFTILYRPGKENGAADALSRRGEDIVYDMLFLKSKGYSVIMVVVDRLSKSAYFAPLKHPYTSVLVATVFLREIIRLHGVSKSIVSDRDQERDQMLEELKRKILRAQQLMKEQADGKQRDVSFGMGDKVYFKLRMYRQGSVVQRANQKLASRFYGPYEVLERVGMVAYKLKLPPASTIHPVFHVAQLKKVIGNQQVQLDFLATNATEPAAEPDTVLGTRKIQQQFPSFHLEDKVVFQGEGDDMNRWGQVYKRKSRGG